MSTESMPCDQVLYFHLAIDTGETPGLFVLCKKASNKDSSVGQVESILALN